VFVLYSLLDLHAPISHFNVDVRAGPFNDPFIGRSPIDSITAHDGQNLLTTAG
jgi:hypothetical protein